MHAEGNHGRGLLLYHDLTALMRRIGSLYLINILKTLSVDIFAEIADFFQWNPLFQSSSSQFRPSQLDEEPKQEKTDTQERY
jgi:hypothetical protein